MDLLDFRDFALFNALRGKMRAPLSSYQAPRIELPKAVFASRPTTKRPVIDLPDEGIVIEDWNNEIKELPDGTLGRHNRRVLAYIRDADTYIPRFHLAYCVTLKEMKEHERFGRYVAAEGKNKLFDVRMNGGSLTKMSLKPCQNCLHKLHWKGFYLQQSTNAKNRIVDDFSVEEFFQRHPKSLHHTEPTRHADNAPVNEYPTNWEEISASLRKQFAYSCQDCGVVLGEQFAKYLHVHHLNGLKNDCQPENLRCLCIRCHSAQPKHRNLRSTLDYQLFCTRFPAQTNR